MYPSSLSRKITPLYFFSSNNISFSQKGHIKMKIFETFKCFGKTSSNSSYQSWKSKSISFQIFHHSSVSWHITHITLNFKLTPFLLWIKGSHQSSNFETFKSSGENFPYSSCHFLNHKSVFLQILHHHSVSWKITPLYSFKSNIKYFAHFSLKQFWTFLCVVTVVNCLSQFLFT